ncbi:hypothetical protein P7C71_g1403, partial [Lecanoromycetidae sp. Uapishka_2]
MSRLAEMWALKVEGEITDLGASLYQWFIDIALGRGIASPHVLICLSSMLQRVIEIQPDYAKSISLQSERTSLLKVLSEGSIVVKFHIGNNIAGIFGLFVLTEHESILEDVKDKLPNDPAWIEGIALRLFVLAHLAATWSTVLRRCVYYIMECPGHIPDSANHAKACLELITTSLQLTEPQELFKLFVSQILFTWLESEPLRGIPYTVFGYGSLADLLRDVQDDVIGHVVMRGKDDEATQIAEDLEMSFNELLQVSFSKAAAYSIGRDIAIPRVKNTQGSEAGVRAKLDREQYNLLLVTNFAQILALVFKSTDPEGEVEKAFQKHPEFGSAAKAYQEILGNTGLGKQLPMNQQPSFKAKYLLDQINHLCHRTSYDMDSLWTPTLYIFVFREVLNGIHPALGSLHAEIGGQQSTRDIMSEAYNRWFHERTPKKESAIVATRILLEALLYLKTQPLPRETVQSDRFYWLNIDYRQAAAAAIKSSMFKTALMFLEIDYSENVKIVEGTKQSRRSSTIKRHELTEYEEPTDLLLEVYENIDEQDAFYGVQQPSSLTSMMTRLEYEHAGFKSLSFRGAHYDGELRRSGGGHKADEESMVRALDNLDLNGLSRTLLSNIANTSQSAMDSMLRTARKLEQWDVPTPVSYTSTASTIFKSFQVINSATSPEDILDGLNCGFAEAMGSVINSKDGKSSMHNILGSLATLTEADEVFSCRRPDQLYEVLDRFKTREQWMYSDRLHGALQNALTTATYLNQLVKPCEEAGVDISAAVQLESANVLWGQGEMTASIRMLQDLKKSTTSPSQLVRVGKPELLAKLGHQISEARLEKPDEIINRYLAPAIDELRGRTDGDEAGQVFHEFASFCDRQLQNPDGLEDFQRIQKLRDRKEAEVKDMTRMMESKNSQSRERNLIKAHRDKAKQWFDLDNREYQRLRDSRQTFLRQSLENYLLCLKACNKHDNDALRFSALWLENYDSDIANAAVDEATSKQGSKVPLRKYPTGQRVEQDVLKQKVPPPTARIELRADCDYSRVPFIARFQPEFTVAGGISAPKIVTAIGTDGQKYKQLFKGGNDDLRQDAIMEQVFEQVSNLLRTQRATRQRNLGIRTYKVLPLTNSAGIIEFVPNTIPLHDYLLPAHQRHFPKDLKPHNARKFITDAQNRSADYRLEQYQKVCRQFHPVLRYFFTERFENPDSWFEKRLAYTRSTAAISILGHVLGLGDRHGHNILLDEETGDVVHIDLGIAFEQGRVLAVPEIVPFRLTRDLVDGMGITKTEGVFRRCCEFTLDALRKESYSIMTILDVLRYDPLYSWSLSPLRLKKMQDAQTEEPNLKQENGVVDGAGNGGGAKKEDEGEAERALTVVKKKLSKSLSVQATVNELIQMATDERNLAVLFAGWAAYA